MKLEDIIKLKQNNFEIVPPKKEAIDLAAYPWDQCIADQTEKYGDEETAKKVCGAIKAMYGSKETMQVEEKFVIPQPEAGEAEDKYISRCMSAIGSEYDTQEQALAGLLRTIGKVKILNIVWQELSRVFAREY